MNEDSLQDYIHSLAVSCKTARIVQDVDGGGADCCSSSSIAIATPVLPGGGDLTLAIDDERTLSSVPMVRSSGLLGANAHLLSPAEEVLFDPHSSPTTHGTPLLSTFPVTTADDVDEDEEAENEQLRMEIEHALTMDALLEANAISRSSSPLPQRAVESDNLQLLPTTLSQRGTLERIQSMWKAQFDQRWIARVRGGTLPLGDLSMSMFSSTDEVLTI